jgi:hypothetical protein
LAALAVPYRFFTGSFDNVVRGLCHEIFGLIAMQHAQLNFFCRGTKWLVAVCLLLDTGPALADVIAKPSRPDTLLDGGPTSACDMGAEYVPGMDATGRPVVPADVGAPPVPVPDSIAVPLRHGRAGQGRNPAAGGDGPYVGLDGKRLAPLLNPPTCR